MAPKCALSASDCSVFGSHPQMLVEGSGKVGPSCALFAQYSVISEKGGDSNSPRRNSGPQESPGQGGISVTSLDGTRKKCAGVWPGGRLDTLSMKEHHMGSSSSSSMGE